MDRFGDWPVEGFYGTVTILLLGVLVLEVAALGYLIDALGQRWPSLELIRTLARAILIIRRAARLVVQ